MGIKKINVEVTDDDLKQLLRKNVVMPKAPQFIDLLMGHICKERYAMEQIYKALLGIYPTFKYKEGDWVYIDFTYLANWRIDKDLTLALKGVKEKKYVPCHIYELDMYSESPYKIKYKAVKSGDIQSSEQEYYATDNGIYGKVETLEEVLDEIEDIIIKEEGDLPF